MPFLLAKGEIMQCHPSNAEIFACLFPEKDAELMPAIRANLSPQSRAKVRDHLRRCKECRDSKHLREICRDTYILNFVFLFLKSGSSSATSAMRKRKKKKLQWVN
jgi:hypothetical protein